MKNTKILISFILMSLAISLSSCKKEESSEDENANSSQSSYKIYVDGDLLTESSDTDVDILNGDLYAYSGSNDDITLFMSNVPEIGNAVNVDYDAYIDDLYNGGDGSTFSTLDITGNLVDGISPYSPGKLEMYTGTITRESKYKVSFVGTFYYFMDSSSILHDFHGEAIADSVIE